MLIKVLLGLRTESPKRPEIRPADATRLAIAGSFDILVVVDADLCSRVVLLCLGLKLLLSKLFDLAVVLQAKDWRVDNHDDCNEEVKQNLDVALCRVIASWSRLTVASVRDGQAQRDN